MVEKVLFLRAVLKALLECLFSLIHDGIAREMVRSYVLRAMRVSVVGQKGVGFGF